MNVERVYHLVKDMAVSFHLRPGERVNEGALAKKLGTSRTPLREALNRLTAERLLDFQPNKGFFCRGLDPQEVFDLYEYRRIIEEAAIRLACQRASDAQLTSIAQDKDLFRWTIAGYTTAQYVGLDENFHQRIAQASGNQELLTQLGKVNERLRFIRWLSMENRVRESKSEHLAIMAALSRRDADACAALIGAHIGKRHEQVTQAVRQAYAQIYVGDPVPIPSVAQSADNSGWALQP